MGTINRNPETGKIIPHRFSIRKLERASEDLAGFCIACGDEHDGIDPDGRKCHCDSCGMNYVFGAEELGLMGYVK